MIKKRFTYEYDEYNGNLFDNEFNTFYHIEDSDENIELLCNRLNELVEENKRLKSQLYCDDEEGICNICKHHYLVSDDEGEWGYYNSRCKKGHYECARISLKHCEDFENEVKND